jgi:hypothetical protein
MGERWWWCCCRDSGRRSTGLRSGRARHGSVPDWSVGRAAKGGENATALGEVKKSSGSSGMLRALGRCLGGRASLTWWQNNKRARRGVAEGPTWATQEAQHGSRLWGRRGLLITAGTGKYSTRAMAEGRETARSRRGARRAERMGDGAAPTGFGQVNDVLIRDLNFPHMRPCTPLSTWISCSMSRAGAAYTGGAGSLSGAAVKCSGALVRYEHQLNGPAPLQSTVPLIAWAWGSCTLRFPAESSSPAWSNGASADAS